MFDLEKSKICKEKNVEILRLKSEFLEKISKFLSSKSKDFGGKNPRLLQIRNFHKFTSYLAEIYTCVFFSNGFDAQSKHEFVFVFVL